MGMSWLLSKKVFLPGGGLHPILLLFMKADNVVEFLSLHNCDFSSDFFEPLEFYPGFFKGFYCEEGEAISHLKEAFSFFSLEMSAFMNAYEQGEGKSLVRWLRECLWSEMFGSQSFLTIAESIKQGFNICNAAKFVTTFDFEALFTTEMETSLYNVLHAFEHPEDDEDLDSNEKLVTNNVIFALSELKPSFISNFVSLVYGCPYLPSSIKWKIKFLTHVCEGYNCKELRVCTSSTCDKLLVVDKTHNHGHTNLKTFMEHFEMALLSGPRGFQLS